MFLGVSWLGQDMGMRAQFPYPPIRVPPEPEGGCGGHPEGEGVGSFAYRSPQNWRKVDLGEAMGRGINPPNPPCCPLLPPPQYPLLPPAPPSPGLAPEEAPIIGGACGAGPDWGHVPAPPIPVPTVHVELLACGGWEESGGRTADPPEPPHHSPPPRSIGHRVVGLGLEYGGYRADYSGAGI